MKIRDSYIATILNGAIMGVLVNSIFVISEWYATSKNGTDILLWISLIWIFPLLLALLAMFGGLVGILTRWKKRCLKISLFSLVFFFAGVLMVLSGNWLRMSEFSELAERSKPIISAIEGYEKTNGHAPSNLSSLVPEYLSEIPNTGMGAYPDYNFYSGEKAKEYEGNPWVLEVFTPSAGFNFDIFFYLPMQNYPERGYGGVLERIGKWAYVHE